MDHVTLEPTEARAGTMVRNLWANCDCDWRKTAERLLALCMERGIVVAVPSESAHLEAECKMLAETIVAHDRAGIDGAIVHTGDVSRAAE